MGIRNYSFSISIVLILAVVLAITSISLLAELNSLNKDYKNEIAKNIIFQRKIKELKNKAAALSKKNASLKEERAEFNSKISVLGSQIGELGLEVSKLEELKDKLEDNLGDVGSEESPGQEKYTSVDFTMEE